MDALQLWWLARAIGAVSPTSVPVYQTAAFRPDNPDTPVLLTGTTLTGAGEKSAAAYSLTSAVSTKFWIRFGVAVKAGAAGLAQADVGLQAAFVPLGQVVGSAAINTLVASSTPAYFPIGGPIPAIVFSKLRLAYLLESVSGHAAWKIAYRTGPTSLATMGSWNTLAAETTWRTTLGEGCTPEIAQSLTASDFWVQFGIACALSGGATAGPVVLQTILGVRK